MEKKMKYDFKLKLKFLNFFYLHKVMPPSNFSPKMNNRGDDMTPNFTVIHIYINLEYLLKYSA